VIVAEISKTWATDSQGPGIHALFEETIQVNIERGYTLHSWRFSQTIHGEFLVETIIAVFKEKS